MSEVRYGIHEICLVCLQPKVVARPEPPPVWQEAPRPSASNRPQHSMEPEEEEETTGMHFLVTAHNLN